MKIFCSVIPEDYRATSVAMFPVGIAERGCVIQALFAPTSDIVIHSSVEAFLRLVARRPGSQSPLANIRFARGKYPADEVVRFKLNSSTTLEGGEILYVVKEITNGVISFPEGLVQVECR